MINFICIEAILLQAGGVEGILDYTAEGMDYHLARHARDENEDDSQNNISKMMAKNGYTPIMV